MSRQDLRFTATDEKRTVAALVQRPPDARALIVLAHGAGAGMRHHHMESIADALANMNIATLRFNFPFMEAGGKRTGIYLGTGSAFAENGTEQADPQRSGSRTGATSGAARR